VSKLFELLHKNSGEIADAVRPLVDGKTGRTARLSGGMKNEDSSAVAWPHAEARAGSEPGFLPQFRTINLHVPAPSPLLPFEEGHWRPGEQYRILRTKIHQHPMQPRVIVISSPDSGDGKSVTAINTAGALALKSEGQVLLLDGDLRRSAISSQLGVPESPGLADALAGTCTLEESIAHTHELPNLFVMPSGTGSANPVDLLDSKAWQALCERLRSLFRYVIIDSPPMGAVADYDLIQALSDGVILVIRPDFTNRGLCLSSLRAMPKGKFLGVVLNCVPDWSPGKHASPDYYYYSGENG